VGNYEYLRKLIMSIKYVLTNVKRKCIMEFEWDNNKNAANIMKHGVSFEAAKEVFYDPLRVDTYDLKNSISEDRWKVLGLSDWVLLLVCCTERNGVIRIISARKATKKEMEEYYNGYCTSINFWS
jgi:uncharacterized DUF497 family protein